ncbi:MAG: phosphoribosylformylglycinamidine synthase, partial [Eubacterium sp.]|nr:phosphoribosylformylglycinamidine synthase [Eubacterium sp.]
MVYRIFVEKRENLANEAASLLSEIRDFLKINSITNLRILNRYDAENITEELFETAVKTVFSEPQTDITYKEPALDGNAVFAVEYLPGQFDQRADSAAQCIQLISCGERPIVRAAKVYVLYGDLTKEEIAAVKKYVINPVDSR